MKNRKPFRLDDYLLDQPPRPSSYSYEAPQGDPLDASNEPDAYSPLMMIQPGAEDVSADDNSSLDGWIDSRMLDERMVPRRQDRTMLMDDPNANEYLADDALEMTAGMRGEKMDPERFEMDQRFGAGDKQYSDDPNRLSYYDEEETEEQQALKYHIAEQAAGRRRPDYTPEEQERLRQEDIARRRAENSRSRMMDEIRRAPTRAAIREIMKRYGR